MPRFRSHRPSSYDAEAKTYVCSTCNGHDLAARRAEHLLARGGPILQAYDPRQLNERAAPLPRDAVSRILSLGTKGGAPPNLKDRHRRPRQDPAAALERRFLGDRIAAAAWRAPDSMALTVRMCAGTCGEVILDRDTGRRWCKACLAAAQDAAGLTTWLSHVGELRQAGLSWARIHQITPRPRVVPPEETSADIRQSGRLRRDLAMAQLYYRGADSYEEIGQRFGITRQAVHNAIEGIMRLLPENSADARLKNLVRRLRDAEKEPTDVRRARRRSRLQARETLLKAAQARLLRAAVPD